MQGNALWDMAQDLRDVVLPRTAALLRDLIRESELAV